MPVKGKQKIDVYINNFLQIQLYVYIYYFVICWMDDQLKNTFGATELNSYYLLPIKFFESTKYLSISA